MKKIILMASLILFVAHISAQSIFQPGYIITLAGDTVFGEIDYQDNIYMSTNCRFRENPKDTVRIYSPNDIASYRFQNGKFYVSKLVNSNPLFLEYLVSGRLSIYYSYNTTGEHYYLEKAGGQLLDISSNEEVVTRNGVDYFHRSNKHIGILKYYLQDAPDLFPQIEAIVYPTTKNMIDLATKYNNETCGEGQCTIYEKKISPVKISIEPTIGYMWMRFSEESGLVEGGALAHVNLPKFNENWYLRAGIIAYNSSVNGFGVVIPVQLEYIYPKGIIRPWLAVGVDARSMLAATCSAGLNLKLDKKVFWVINYDAFFSKSSSMTIFYNRFSAQAVLTGISITL